MNRVHRLPGTQRLGALLADDLAVVDLRVALVVVLELLSLVYGPSPDVSARWLAEGAGLLTALAGLLVQRARPRTGMLLVLAGTIAQPVPLTAVWPVLAAVIEAGRRQSVAEAVGWAIGAAVAVVVQLEAWTTYVEHRKVSEELFVIALAALGGLLLGTRKSAREERRARVEERAVLQSERSHAEERAAIAREVHDVVAHSLTLIVVQAQLLAQRTAEGETRDGAEGIAQHAREAVAELQHTVSLLRGQAPRRPQATLDDVRAIVEQSRASGLAVTFSSEGEPAPIPAALELTAVRIVQEALTNSAKHAPGATVRVIVRYQPDHVEAEVVDDGAAATAPAAATVPAAGTVPAAATAPAATDGGMGLIGMRERVRLHGGTFSAGPCTPTGFRVFAILPIPDGGHGA